MSESAATWPDGSPKTPESIAAEVTGHTYGCNCLACDRAKAPTSAASEERMTVVLLVELVDATQDEFKAAVEAVKSTLVPLGITDRIRLHATIHDAAERVMDAFEGRRSE